MTSKPRNSLENFGVCYGDTACFPTIFQDFATEILNVSLLCSNTHHPTKTSQSPFIYLGLCVVGCLKTPHQHYTNTPPNSHSMDLGSFHRDKLVIRLISMILTLRFRLQTRQIIGFWWGVGGVFGIVFRNTPPSSRPSVQRGSKRSRWGVRCIRSFVRVFIIY